MMSVQSLERAIEAQRCQLVEHRLFKSLSDADDLRVFMQWHVFAVWDFMSLVKRLQRDLAGASVPWTMPTRRRAARFINEIVLGEESDETPSGYMSHFELYIHAMREIGAQTEQICGFVDRVAVGVTVEEALQTVCAPEPVRKFVTSTMDVCENGHTHEVLGNFFFGREDIIPLMFRSLLAQWAIKEETVPLLSYYLKRHISMDSEEHGPAARAMIEEVVNADPARVLESLSAGWRAIQARLNLWDGLHAVIVG